MVFITQGVYIISKETGGAAKPVNNLKEAGN
jgi:hypothetical protein